MTAGNETSKSYKRDGRNARWRNDPRTSEATGLESNQLSDFPLRRCWGSQEVTFDVSFELAAGINHAGKPPIRAETAKVTIRFRALGV